MGMGYGACFNYVVEEDVINNFCKEEFDLFKSCLDKFNVSFDIFSRSMSYMDEIRNDDDEELDESEQDEIMFFYEKLIKKFNDETGLTLDIGYHNQEDDGDRYDEVDGGFFVLGFDELFIKTPKTKKAEKMGVKFKLKTWVTYG